MIVISFQAYFDVCSIVLHFPEMIAIYTDWPTVQHEDILISFTQCASQGVKGIRVPIIVDPEVQNTRRSIEQHIAVCNISDAALVYARRL